MDQAVPLKLLRPLDPQGDHVRPLGGRSGSATVLIYGDYFCPFCRRLAGVLLRLRGALGDRMTYAYRHFPNEHAHPGATYAALASEAAGRQDHFWQLHDALFALQPPLTEVHVRKAAASVGLDMDRFDRDLGDPALRVHVEDDLKGGRCNGVTSTPTIFIDGQRYDGAWDFYSMLETLERTVATRVQRTARAFAALPASGGLVLLLAAAAALGCANTALAPLYRQVVGMPIGVAIGDAAPISLSVGGWCSDGLLTLFFLLVGLEIRREMAGGALGDRRAAVLPVVCAIGGVLAPAAIYLAINRGPTAVGWSAPTSTDTAFALGVLALVGRRAPIGIRVFVAALSVVDDILMMLILAVFYPRDLHPVWLGAAIAVTGLMFALNRWRVYSGWPYLLATTGVWLSLHAAGLNAGLSGIALSAFVPTRPAPDAGPLLAQAATALSDLEQAESAALARNDDKADVVSEPIWEWASRNLSAASARLLSPADRVERAISPWAAYVVLPLFAFTATGVALDLDLHAPNVPRVLAGVVIGLVVGKPLGISLAALAAVKVKVSALPYDVSPRLLIGAAILCGVSDPMALLITNYAFPAESLRAAAKIGILAGSVVAAALGISFLVSSPPPRTPAEVGR
jgi:NhaA family Na+:H+ antiporter